MSETMQGLDAGFDSREDYEMYMKLMTERQKIQRQLEEKKRKKKVLKTKKLEERERGFQLYVSGANEERIEEARRREQKEEHRSRAVRPSGGSLLRSGSREWQMETVELRGKDGQVFRTSPSEGAIRPGSIGPSNRSSREGVAGPFEVTTDEEIGEEFLDESSRPPTSGSGVDQETRGVLRMMQTANVDELQLLRESLAQNIERRVPASPGTRMRASLSASNRSSSTRLLDAQHSRPSSATGAELPGSRPSSSCSDIASAIQAENARVRARHGEGSDSTEVLNVSSNLEQSSSRPSSRPSSKAGRRLPLSPEAALESAPPSVIAGAAPARRPPGPQAAAPLGPYPSAAAGGAASSRSMLPPSGSGGYSVPNLPRAPAASTLQAEAAAPSPNRSPAALRRPSAERRAGSASEGEGPNNRPGEIVDRVSRLDRRKQKALLRILDSLEAEQQAPVSATPAQAGSAPPLAPVAASAAAPVPQLSAPAGRADGAIRFRVLSNWGAPRQCGLSLIEAFDKSGEVLRIPPAALTLQGTQSGSTSLPRVVEGNAQATTEKAMWVASVCPKPDGNGFEPFELVLNWPPSASSPSSFRIWNFNSPEGLTKGLRDVEVWRSGCQVWQGQVPCGTGSTDIVPAVAMLDSGLPSAAPAMVAPVMSGQPGAGGYPAGQKPQDWPVWLDGAAAAASLPSADAAAAALPPGLPIVDGGDWDDDSSPKPKGRRETDRDKELMQSLKALEEFRASQSRRFFGQQSGSQEELREGLAGLAPNGDDLAQAAEWRPPVDSSSLPTAALRPPEQLIAPAPSPEAMLGGSYTADFGARAPQRPPQVDSALEATPAFDQVPLSFDGVEIPVIEFDGGDADALDGLLGDNGPSSTVMGSSMIGNTFGASVTIPTMPCGRTLVFNCLRTWGDQNFVGLAGIEIFDSRGFPVVLKDVEKQVSADPPSINVLPEYDNDPRTVDKLFDQVNLTRDDLHVWLAPFFPGRAHAVTVDLELNTHLSMIRVWNYNKSRLHSSRGVRDLEILLDGVPIFVGEIRQAPGGLTHPEEACEHILFTQDEGVLEVVEEHDWLPAHLPLEPEEGEEDMDASLLGNNLDAALRQVAAERPPTAGFEAQRPLGSELNIPRAEDSPRYSAIGADGRPITRACNDRVSARGCLCGSITLVLHSTWGDAFYIGLTALELLDASLQPIAIDASQIDASPRDLNDLEEVDGDPRTIDKLLDGVNCTTDDHHMWMAPFTKVPMAVESRAALTGGEGALLRNLIRIDLGDTKREVAGFNVWNYNKNVEDTCRGVKEFSVYCDEKYVATFLCRKAPGHVHFDFKQVILLDQPPCMDGRPSRVQGVPPVAPRMPSRDRGSRCASNSRRSAADRSCSRDGRRAASRERARSRGPAGADPTSFGGLADPAGSLVQQQYETPTHPCGFLFKLVLLSTWSDAHYIGLDGVELCNLGGQPLRPKRVHSNHGSVRNLPSMENDIRTEDNLLKGAPGDSGRMWLAPLVRHPPNSIELVFDEPTRISCVHFWNYSRTPARGARDIELYVDDLLVYQGILRQEDGASSSFTRGAGSGPGRGSPGEAVLFTTLPDIVARERSFVYLPSADELVTFFDESGKLDNGNPFGPGLLERPMTALTH